jgi:RHH-type proline utilization regulon transcriptional repressor/proline dehydrogenase/delta 1-pyrroline-5-carboxylate dehydrogenase
MLGEAARTMGDADRYERAYHAAIAAIGAAAGRRGPIESPGISVKLSALHPRYEFAQRQRAMDELVPRLKGLAMAARRVDIGFTVDAEEADRLDLSLDVIEAVSGDSDLAGWNGFGLAMQAYQKRCIHLIDWLGDMARRRKRRLMVRLVKGAYWDSEIKWSQERGCPVPFHAQASTTCPSGLCQEAACRSRCLHPQFATHNALRGRAGDGRQQPAFGSSACTAWARHSRAGVGPEKMAGSAHLCAGRQP